MEVFIGVQIKTLAESFILGLIFGAGYDIICMIQIFGGIMSYSKEIAVKGRKFSFLLFLVLDIVYMLVITFSYSVFLYHYNNGIFRTYLFAGCVSGFVLYYQTLGRLVRKVSEKIVGILRTVVYVMIIRPLRLILKTFLRISFAIARHTIGRISKWLRIKKRLSYMRNIQKRMPEYINI